MAAERFRALCRGQRGPIRRSLSRALRDIYYTTEQGVEGVGGTVLVERGGAWVVAVRGPRA